MFGRIVIVAVVAALAGAEPALADSDAVPVSQLGSAWTPVPAVLAGTGLALALFVQAFVRLRRRGRADHAGWSRLVLFVLALVLGTLPLVSPLDAVGDTYLLSGHMLQHVLISDAAPALALAALRGPLVMFILPKHVLRPVARTGWLRSFLCFVTRPRFAFAAWIAVTAGWHVPAAYDYALRNETVHDLEHVSFVIAGTLVWMQIVDPARRKHLRVPQRIAFMLAVFGAGAVLAGLLVLWPTPLYPAYAAPGDRLLGITPVQDQALAGIVMLGEQLATLGLCAWFLVRASALPLVLPIRRRLAPAHPEHPLGEST